MSDKLISRREFLSRAATAGLGLLISPAVGKAISFQAGDYYIVMGSDPHIGYSGANDSMESFVVDVVRLNGDGTCTPVLTGTFVPPWANN